MGIPSGTACLSVLKYLFDDECLMALVSCEEHTDIYDNRVSVGNILLSDNTLISPYGYDKDCHQAVGVVFYTSRDTALVVGLRELGEYEYTDSMATVSGVKNDAYSMCGAENTAAIMASEDLYSPAVEVWVGFAVGG